MQLELAKEKLEKVKIFNFLTNHLTNFEIQRY